MTAGRATRPARRDDERATGAIHDLGRSLAHESAGSLRDRSGHGGWRPVNQGRCTPGRRGPQSRVACVHQRCCNGAMDTMLGTLHAQRNLLEGQLLRLERAMDARNGLPEVDVDGANPAQPEAAERAAEVVDLFARLAAVNAELAAMREAPGPA